MGLLFFSIKGNESSTESDYKKCMLDKSSKIF